MFVFREAGGVHTAPLDRGGEESYPVPASGHASTALTVSLPTPFGWYYCHFRFGRERRSAGRLIAEGQLTLAKLSLSYTLAVWILLGLVGLGVMVGIYLIKSMAGIDLLDGASFLHDFVYRQ